jgi:hypothetical protein
VGSLYDALHAIHTGKVADSSILDEYSRVRIKTWQETINPMSRKNFGLIWDPALQTDREQFFAFTKKMEEDKAMATQMAHVSPTSPNLNNRLALTAAIEHPWIARELRGIHCAE